MATKNRLTPFRYSASRWPLRSRNSRRKHKEHPKPQQDRILPDIPEKNLRPLILRFEPFRHDEQEVFVTFQHIRIEFRLRYTISHRNGDTIVKKRRDKNQDPIFFFLILPTQAQVPQTSVQAIPLLWDYTFEIFDCPRYKILGAAQMEIPSYA